MVPFSKMSAGVYIKIYINQREPFLETTGLRVSGVGYFDSAESNKSRDI